MTPAIYIVYGIILTLLACGLLLFAGYAYYLALQIKDAADALSDLAESFRGLPSHFHGITPALRSLAKNVGAHETQVSGLVDVIRDANKNAPVEKPPPFEENGKDTNWAANIPQSSFSEEEENRG